jgi:hypothetical protein
VRGRLRTWFGVQWQGVKVECRDKEKIIWKRQRREETVTVTGRQNIRIQYTK